MDGNLPGWNPFVHGGQPILSNPQYAAFYPATWLALLVSPAGSLSLLVLVHWLLALVGGWSLLRTLGTGRDAAALGAVAFAAGGAYLGLVGLLNVFFGMAWAPWTLAGGHRLLTAPIGRPRRRALLATAVPLAGATLADPSVSALLIGAMLVLMAWSRHDLAWRVRGRILAPVGLAIGLAACQLAPAAAHYSDSPRWGGLPVDTASTWSTPPSRALELLLPRVFGDPLRDEEGLYFGWGIHERDFPLLLSVYPGVLVVSLGCAALLAWPIPYRRGLLAIAALGTLLALGHHTPVYPALAALTPVGVFRYPEKLLLLPLVAIAIAAGLGWEHLQAARGRAARPPLLVAGAAVLVALAWLLWAAGDPAATADFVRSHRGLPPSPDRLLAALRYLRDEALLTLLTALLSLGVLALAYAPRASRRCLSTLALGVLVADLWRVGHGLIQTLPATALAPPPLARALRAWETGGPAHLVPGSRIFSSVDFDTRPEIGARQGESGFDQYLGRLRRLDPQTGVIWGLSYALDADFDLSLTSWARASREVLAEQWRYETDPSQPWLPGNGSRRILAAWGVGQMVVRRSANEMLAAARGADEAPPLARLVAIPETLPVIRRVGTLVSHRNLADALRATQAEGYAVANREHVVDLDQADGKPEACASAEVSTVTDHGEDIVLDVRAAGPSCLVLANTFHESWRASVDGNAVPLLPTALGYQALRLPAGRHRVALAFRDPWVRVGLATSWISGLLCVLILLRATRAEGSATEEPGPAA